MKDKLNHIISGQTLWPGLLCIVIGFVILFPGTLFQGKTIIPGDLQSYYYPWRAEFPPSDSGPSNWILFDEILEFYPWREHLRTSLLNGTIPLWDSTAFCGYPFQGLYQTGFLYLPDRIADPLPFDAYSVFRSLLHLLIAGVGTGLLLRQLKMKTPAITFGMCAYAFSGFMIVWLGHPHCKVAAWLPWLFLGVESLIDKKRHAPLMTLTGLSMTLLAGHIETALHTLSIVVFYLILRLFRLRFHFKLQTVRSWVILLVISLLLSGAMSIPFAEYLAESVAFNTRSDGVITQGWLDRITSLAILLPDAFGNNARSTHWYPGFNTSELGGAFAGATTAVFALAACIIGIRKRQIWIHMLIAGISGCVAYGVPPIYQIVTMLPGYRMSYNFRMVLPMVFSLTVLAAHFIEYLQSTNWRKSRSYLMQSLTTVSAVTALGTICLYHRFQSMLEVNLLLPLIFLGGFMLTGCLLIPYLAHKWHPVMLMTLSLVVATELLLFGYGYNPTCQLKTLETLPISASELSVASDAEPFRTLPVGRTYPPHSSLRFGMHDLRGNDALTPLVTEDYIALFETDMRRPDQLPALRMMWLSQWNSHLVDALNVKYITFPIDQLETVPRDLQPFKTLGGIHLFKNPKAFPRVFLVPNWQNLASDNDVLNALAEESINLKTTAYLSTPATLPTPHKQIEKQSVDSIFHSPHAVDVSFQSSNTALLILSDTFFPGWKARVDNKLTTIHRVNHMMRGVFVDAGQHHISFSYEPQSFRLGLFLTFLGVLLTVLYLTISKHGNVNRSSQ